MNINELCHLLLNVPYLLIEKITFENGQLQLAVKTQRSTAICPVCTNPSQAIHSTYQRNPRDLPWGTLPVVLHLSVKRFFCQNPSCPKQTFAERFPDLVGWYARCTQRVIARQAQIMTNTTARTAERLLKEEQICLSDTTINRLMRGLPDPESQPVRELGVDDWAMRKGRTYGTILVDLDRHRVVDLLSDRTSEELSQWLKEHPGVEIITRDRSGSYAGGARQGAPDAVQVADRFHLLINLNETLQQILQRHPGVLKISLSSPAQTSSGETNTVQEQPEQEVHASLQQKQERYQQVQQLRSQGKSLREIATNLNIAINTAMKYASLQEAPQQQVRSTRKTRGYEALIAQQWNTGTREVKQIFRELRSRGYRGSYQTLARYVADGLGSTTRKPHAQHLLLPLTVSVPVSRAAWVLGKPAEKLDAEEQQLVEQLCQAADWVPQTYTLAQGFQKMVRERRADQLDTWLGQAKSSSATGLRNFALGLQKDHEAIQMALSHPQSNGQTEGQVNRLKCLKRMMYGRAKADLLRKRVLWQGKLAFT